MTQTVAEAYEGLPAAQRSQACIFTSNYGEASALNFLGDRYDLPPAISGHNNYYLWGPGRCTGETMITVGFLHGELELSYEGVASATPPTGSSESGEEAEPSRSRSRWNFEYEAARHHVGPTTGTA